MIWKKLERRGGAVIPESMLDVRDEVQRRQVQPGPHTSLDVMRELVRDRLGADIGIWGKVERVAGHEWDVYDLWIRIADFREEPPRLIVDAKARTKTASEIPHVHVAKALDALFGGPVEKAEPPLDAAAMERRWRTGANLVKGDFERGRESPLGWDPLPQHVSRVAVTNGRRRTQVIRFSIPRNVAASTGVLYYSDYFPVEAGARYRFQCRWRTTGCAVKVFIKCYHLAPTKYSRPAGRSAQERREVYNSQQNLTGQSNTWQVHTQDFTPQHPQFTPRWGRVMLYAYWPEGAVEWDDVVVKKVAPAPRETSNPTRDKTSGR
jgi:hypothetical protein